MENASKALIIAAAILLAILLISLGIMVYNNAKGTISDANLDQETAQAFNTKITQYCGTKKNGITINSLVDTIAAVNGAQQGKAAKHEISLIVQKDTQGVTPAATHSPYSKYGPGVTGDLEKKYPTFDNSHKYYARYNANDDGYIFEVVVGNDDN